MNTLTRVERGTPTSHAEPTYVVPEVDIRETKDEYAGPGGRHARGWARRAWR